MVNGCRFYVEEVGRVKSGRERKAGCVCARKSVMIRNSLKMHGRGKGVVGGGARNVYWAEHWLVIPRSVYRSGCTVECSGREGVRGVSDEKMKQKRRKAG